MNDTQCQSKIYWKYTCFRDGKKVTWLFFRGKNVRLCDPCKNTLDSMGLI